LRFKLAIVCRFEDIYEILAACDQLQETKISCQIEEREQIKSLFFQCIGIEIESESSKAGFSAQEVIGSTGFSVNDVKKLQ